MAAEHLCPLPSLCTVCTTSRTPFCDALYPLCLDDFLTLSPLTPQKVARREVARDATKVSSTCRKIEGHL